MLKIVSLFLIFRAVLAMFGKLRLPKIPRRQGGLPKPRYCKQCAQYKLRGETCEQCSKGRD